MRNENAVTLFAFNPGPLPPNVAKTQRSHSGGTCTPSRLVYVDTNVVLDALLKRTNLFGKDISKPASTLFFRCMCGEFTIVLSSWTEKELYKQVKEDSVRMLLGMIEDHMQILPVTKEDKAAARTRKNTNFDDALHIVLAEKGKCDVIVTRNLSDFYSIGTSIKIALPENL